MGSSKLTREQRREREEKKRREREEKQHPQQQGNNAPLPNVAGQLPKADPKEPPVELPDEISERIHRKILGALPTKPRLIVTALFVVVPIIYTFLSIIANWKTGEVPLKFLQPRLAQGDGHIVQSDASGSTRVSLKFQNPTYLPIRDLRCVVAFMSFRTDKGNKIESPSDAGFVVLEDQNVPWFGAVAINLSDVVSGSKGAGFLSVPGNPTDADVCITLSYRTIFGKKEERFRYRIRNISTSSYEWFPSGTCPPP